MSDPFVCSCVDEKCGVAHAGKRKFTAGQIEDEISNNTDFGKKLKSVIDEEVTNL